MHPCLRLLRPNAVNEECILHSTTRWQLISKKVYPRMVEKTRGSVAKSKGLWLCQFHQNAAGIVAGFQAGELAQLRVCVFHGPHPGEQGGEALGVGGI